MRNFFFVLCLSVLLVAVATAQQEELTAALTLWKSFEIDDCYFNLQTPTSSGTDEVVIYTVHVRDNEVTQVGNIDMVQVRTSISSSIPTIDGLFERIQVGIDNNADVQVTYDEEYGYPVEFSVLYQDADPLEGSILFFLPISVKARELEAAKMKWDAYNYQSYDMVYQYQNDKPGFASFLVPTEIVDIQVRDNEAISITGQESGEDLLTAFGGLAPSVDIILGQIDYAMAQPLLIAIDISYHPTYGYPTSVYIDYYHDFDHDHFDVEIFDLHPLQQGNLDQAKALWESSTRGLSTDYNYKYTVTEDGTSAPYRMVEVRQDVVTNVYSLIASETVGDDPADFPTVPELFDAAQDAINDNNELKELAIIYHPTYGYPVEIYLIRADESELTINVDQLTNFDTLQWALDDSISTWENLELTDYDYVVQPTCICEAMFLLPKKVEVRGGVVSSIVYLDSPDVSVEDVSSIATVEAIYARIQDAIDNYYHIVLAEFHESYGVPIDVSIDPNGQVLADELILEIYDFVPYRFSPEQDDLTEALVLWESKNLNRYAFGYINEDIGDSLLVQVQNGNVLSAADRFGVPVSEDVTMLVPSIEGIFALIQEALFLNADSAVVSYDTEYGFPSSVSIVYYGGASDLSFTVDHLGPIDEWQRNHDTYLALWETSLIFDYTYVYDIVPGDGVSKVIGVQDGEVVSIDGQPLQADPRGQQGHQLVGQRVGWRQRRRTHHRIRIHGHLQELRDRVKVAASCQDFDQRHAQGGRCLFHLGGKR